MKKILYSFASLVISLFILTGCDVDNNTNLYPQMPYYGYWQPYMTNANGQYVIGGYVNGQQATRTAMTRAAIAGGTYTDFALYSWTPDSVVMDGYHGTFSGNTWGYTESVKYFDNDAAAYGFIGVIPQNATQSFDAVNHAVTVSAVGFTTDDAGAQAGTQNDSYAEDRELLYATTTVQKADYANGATLSFNHANVKVYLKFTSDDANTQIVDFTPYTPGSPEIPANPGTQTTTTKTGKALDMLYNGEIVYWPYKGDSNLSASMPNNFYQNTSNYGNMGDLMDVVNAQFVYYKSGSVTTDAWTEGNKKDTYGIQLASSTNKDDFIGGATEDTWKDAFWTNASTQIKNLFRASYAAGWRVIRIEHIGTGNQYDAWLLNNTENTYKVITTTGGTPYQPAVPATGHEGIIVLPATSAAGNGTDAILASYPSAVDATVSLNGITMTETANSNTITFTKPDGYVYTTRVASPTTWYTFPASVNSVDNVGFTVKFSYTYKGVTKYDNRVFIPAADVQWLEGKFYTYVINIHGKGNGTTNPADTDENDPTVPQTDDITVTAVIADYATGDEHEYTIQ
jgi:hypothetical protein